MQPFVGAAQTRISPPTCIPRNSIPPPLSHAHEAVRLVAPPTQCRFGRLQRERTCKYIVECCFKLHYLYDVCRLLIVDALERRDI